MSLVEPKPPRYKTAETPAGLSIVVNSMREWFALFFLPVWLCGWAFGWYETGRKILSGADRTPFTLVWFVGWTVGGVFAAGYFFWLLAGKEEILVTPTTLGIRRSILGISRTKSFRREEIYNPRYRFESSGRRRRSPSCIAFDYGGRTYTFGSGLDEAEADPIISLICRRMNLSQPAQTKGPSFRSLD